METKKPEKKSEELVIEENYPNEFIELLKAARLEHEKSPRKEDTLITTKEAAKLLGISPRTLTNSRLESYKNSKYKNLKYYNLNNGKSKRPQIRYSLDSIISFQKSLGTPLVIPEGIEKQIENEAKLDEILSLFDDD